MDKQEFIDMFKECFDIQLSVGWTEGKFPDYALKLKVVDKETYEVVCESHVSTYEIKN